MDLLPLRKWCTISPLHTHTHLPTLSPLIGLPWWFHKTRISISAFFCICLHSLFFLSPHPRSPQSISNLETGHQLVLQRYIPQPWPVTVPSDMGYFDGPKAYTPSWQLEHVLMDNPTNYMSNWSEGSSPQKGVFYHTQVRNRLRLNCWTHCEESGFVVLYDFPWSQFFDSVRSIKQNKIIPVWRSSLVAEWGKENLSPPILWRWTYPHPKRVAQNLCTCA